MTNLDKNKLADCAWFLSMAYCAINLPRESVKTLFRDRELAEINYMYNETKEVSIEVAFDTTVLTCLFDKNDNCDGVFLSLEDKEDIVYYIQYCSEIYQYNTILGGWMNKDHLIQIKNRPKGFFGLSIYMLPPQQDQRIKA
ncbi:MAG: hypothetical protein AB2L24_09965 [Mangrovibacterium sp.]